MPRAKKIPTDGFIGSGLEPDEVAQGRIRFEGYKTSYPQLNKQSNKQLLEELVWLECLQERFKKQVGIVTQPKKAPDGTTKVESVPGHLQKSIADNLTQIVDIKTKLGLFEDQKTLDAFRDFENLKKKAAEYRAQHPLSFKTSCPHCTKIFYLKRRTEGFEEFISPFYADDKVVKNTPLYNLYKAGKITKEEFAEVLGVSPDYAAWLKEKVYSKHKAS